MDLDAQEVERREWGRRADCLGIPWLDSTDLESLKALVRNKEELMKIAELINGEWQIPGELPNGLNYQDGRFFVGEEEEPSCFGDMWDGAEGGSDACDGCNFAVVCVEKMAKIKLVATQAELGAGATLGALSKAMDITEQSTLLLMARVKGEYLRPPLPRKKKPAEVAGPPAVALVPPVVASPILAEVEIVETKPAKVKKTKKRTGKHAETDKQVDPQVRSAKSAKGGASPRRARAKSARVRAAGSRDPWGKHTWVARHLRERQRSLLIGKLVPGMVVHVDRGGVHHQLKVERGNYLYKGQDYPTLFMVTQVAAGTVERPSQRKANGKRPPGSRQLCNWSAAKFWNLARALAK